MKKIAIVVAVLVLCGAVYAQETPQESGSDLSALTLRARPGDHLLLQFGFDGLQKMPDSISSHQKGWNRAFNLYFMFDKVFKSSPKLSFGIGLGVSTSKINFSKMAVQLNSPSPSLPFVALDSTDHFKKYKLATSFLEVPLELRYTSKPQQYNKSLKIAVGLRLGTMLNAHTKGKDLVTKDGNTINAFGEKIATKRFFNTTRFTATGRVGYGIVGIFYNVSLTSLLKEGMGPDMKPYQFGIVLSAL